jgi:hypothetical protein
VSAEWTPFVSAGIGLVSGLVGGAGGALLGVKLSLVRLEEWRKITDNNINRLIADSGKHNDDLSVFNGEIGMLCRHNEIPRLDRQQFR